MVIENLIPGKLNIICIAVNGNLFGFFVLSRKSCRHAWGELCIKLAGLGVIVKRVCVKAIGDVALGGGGGAACHRVSNVRSCRGALCGLAAGLIAFAPIRPDEAADGDVEACALDEVKDNVNVAHCSEELRKQINKEVNHVIGKEVLVDYRLKKLPQSVAGGVVIINRKLKHTLFNKSSKNIGNCLLDNIVNVFNGVFNVGFCELILG